MKLSIDNKHFKFSFEHRKTSTMCRCEYEGKTYAAGANLAPGDQFCKAKGRRVALTRLLKNGLQELVPCDPTVQAYSTTMKWSPVHIFTRVDRATIWHEYFRQHADLGKKEKLTRIRLPCTSTFVDVPGEYADHDAALKAWVTGSFADPGGAK